MEGRDVTFDAAIAKSVCDQLAEGVSLRAVCRQEGMPSVGTFLGWVASSVPLAEQYASARARCLDAMAEQMLDIADTPQIGEKTVLKPSGSEITKGDMVEHRRLQIETRKWLMAKMAPKKYGDKVQIGGAEDLPPVRTLGDVALRDRIAELQAKLDGGNQG